MHVVYLPHNDLEANYHLVFERISTVFVSGLCIAGVSDLALTQGRNSCDLVFWFGCARMSFAVVYSAYDYGLVAIHAKGRIAQWRPRSKSPRLITERSMVRIHLRPPIVV